MLLWGVFTYRDVYFFEKGKYFISEKNYKEAHTYFSRISDAAISLHNIGNTHVISVQDVLDEEKTHILKQALTAYSWALAIEEKSDTRYNYEYVQRLLDELEQELKNREQEHQSTPQESITETSESESNQEERNNDWEESETTDEKNLSEDARQENSSESSNTLSQERWEKYQLQQNDSTPQLSPEQLQQLEQHIQNLQQDQYQNQRFYGKKDTPSPSDIFDEFFGENPFFQEKFGSTQKDW